LTCEVFFFGVYDDAVSDLVNKTINGSTINESEWAMKEIIVVKLDRHLPGETRNPAKTLIQLE
jgi:hypothetical protein